MTTYFTEGFESGSNGAALTTSNTTFNLINGTAPTFTSSDKKSGSLSMSVSIGGTAAISSGRAPYAGAPLGLIFLRYYIKAPSAWQASNWYPHNFQDSGGTILADCRLPGGVPTIRNGTIAVWTSGKALATGAWYCLEHKLDNANAKQSLTIWDAAGTQYDTSGDQTYNKGATVDHSFIGNTTSLANVAVLFDAIQAGSASIGPIAPAVVHNRYVKSSGGAWVALATKIA